MKGKKPKKYKNTQKVNSPAPVERADDHSILDESSLYDGPPSIPTSLNEELEEKIKDDPNKFIGCGG